MKTLHISVSDKIATYQKRDGDIVCGNNDYQIQFTFDSEWDAYTQKTARFVWGGKHYDKDFSGDVCAVPVLRDTDKVEVGVYAGDLETTTGAEISCRRSILCRHSTPSTENDVDYANEAKEAAARAEEAATRAENPKNFSYETLPFTLEDGTVVHKTIVVVPETSVTFTIYAKVGVEGAYESNFQGVVPNGTTWGKWCSDYNLLYPSPDGDVWINDGGYVREAVWGYFVADSNNNRVKWNDPIVGGDYTDYKETPIEPDEPDAPTDEVVAFSIIQSTGPEQYYTDYARVAKGTTWALWCEYINSNLDPMFIEMVGLMWSNLNGYVWNNAHGFYLEDSNGNNIPWDSEIVGGNYTNFRVDNTVLFSIEYEGDGINTETIDTSNGYENEWAYWCTQYNMQQGGEEIWANNNGYIYHNMLGEYLLDINGNKVPWGALIVNGGYYLVAVTIQPPFDPETMSITFILPNGESYTTKKGTTFEQFANARPDVLAQGSGSTYVTMSNGEMVGLDGELCIYTDVIIDGGAYMGMGA